MRGRPKVGPSVLHDGIAAGTVGLEGSDASVGEAEVDQRAAQSGAQPQRPYLPLYLFEDEDAAGYLGMEACRLDDPHQCIGVAVTIDVARAEAVDRVGQPPLVFSPSRVRTTIYSAQVVETVVLLCQAVRPVVLRCQVAILRPPSQQGLDLVLEIGHLCRAFLQLAVAVDQEELRNALYVVERQRLA